MTADDVDDAVQIEEDKEKEKATKKKMFHNDFSLIKL